MLTQEEAIITFEMFKEMFKKHAKNQEIIKPRDLDCVYLYLLKGGEHDISTLSEA